MAIVFLASAVALLGLLPNLSKASPNCPILGPDFPPPRSLSTNAAVKAAFANLTEVLNAGGVPNSTFEQIGAPEYTSFSLEVFSAHESKSFEYHYSAPILANSTTGVKKVNSDSIYRIGSISKLYTVYTFLIEVGDVKFHDPITKYVPELRTAAREYNAQKYPTEYVDWESITVGMLASQMADIGRDYSTFGELTQVLPDPTVFGLPPLNASQIPACGGSPLPLCDRTAFFEGFVKKHPVFASSTTPIYSNVAFQILAYALERIKGKPFEEMLNKNVIERLNLSHTTLNTPNDTKSGVIPTSNVPTTEPSEISSGWSFQTGDEGPAGSIYSSAHDMSTLGRSILLSSLLPGSLTRRWLKPVSFTSYINAAVGAPWEISRIPLSYPPYVVDLYTKAGAIGVYRSNLVLIPDWDIGFIVLSAGPGASLTIQSMVNLIIKFIFPAIETAAREEATTAYVGHYNSSSSTLNSSVTIASGSSYPGLRVTSLISNGTDMLKVLALYEGGSTSLPVTFTLYPTNLRTETGNGEAKLAWRGVLEFSTLDRGPGSDSCRSWAGVDGLQYGSVATDDFLFTLGGDGKAISVEPRILRVDLKKI